MRTYTIKQKKQAVALYRGGLSCRQVGEKLGIPRDTVRGWAREDGVTRTKSQAARLRGRDHPAQVRERAVALYRAGLSCLQVSERMGINAGSIHHWVKKAGCNRSPRAAFANGQRAQQRRELSAAIWRGKADGLTLREIAERAGCSLSTVSRYLREASYPDAYKDRRSAA